VPAQSSASPSEARISEIRAWYAATEHALPSYRTKEFDLDGFSLEGGVLHAYFAGDTLRKLSGEFLGESGRALEEYYIRNDTMYFTYRKLERYDRPMSGRVENTSENRFYFRGDSLVAWIDSAKHRSRVDSREADENRRDEIATARSLIECVLGKPESHTCVAPPDSGMH
jgi:hypothetical protein